MAPGPIRVQNMGLTQERWISGSNRLGDFTKIFLLKIYRRIRHFRENLENALNVLRAFFGHFIEMVRFGQNGGQEGFRDRRIRICCQN